MQNIIDTIRRYRKMVAEIEDLRIYDGRGKGVDVYTCDGCTNHVFTRYGDKGVTPFTIRCNECGGTMTHIQTISEGRARYLPVENWVRPSLVRTILSSQGTREHILNGGLILQKKP